MRLFGLLFVCVYAFGGIYAVGSIPDLRMIGAAALYAAGLVAGMLLAASRIEARSDETPQAAQPEGREPDPKGDAQ
jgi:hypothetical protein